MVYLYAFLILGLKVFSAVQAYLAGTRVTQFENLVMFSIIGVFLHSWIHYFIGNKSFFSELLLMDYERVKCLVFTVLTKTVEMVLTFRFLWKYEELNFFIAIYAAQTVSTIIATSEFTQSSIITISLQTAALLIFYVWKLMGKN